MKTKSTPWTSSEIALLARGYPTGTSIEEFARRLSRTPGAIRRQVQRLALSRSGYRHWSRADTQLLYSCYRLGTPVDQLASTFGRPRHAVVAKARSLGVRHAAARRRAAA